MNWSGITKYGKGLGRRILSGGSGMSGIVGAASTGAVVGGIGGAISSAANEGEGFGRRTIKGALTGAAMGAGFGGFKNARASFTPNTTTKALARIGPGVRTGRRKMIEAGAAVRSAGAGVSPKAQKVYDMMSAGATESERAAAARALVRMRTRGRG